MYMGASVNIEYYNTDVAKVCNGIVQTQLILFSVQANVYIIVYSTYSASKVDNHQNTLIKQSEFY